MTFGELDFADIFLDGEAEQPQPEDIVLFPAATYVVFCLFLFLMGIVIMNTFVSITENTCINTAFIASKTA